jgi:GNAT superfamily N-acetyltransferase
MKFSMRPATANDAKAICEILHAAAQWLKEGGRPMWRVGELQETRIAEEIDHFFVAEMDGEIVGTLKIDLEDPVFWPDHPEPSAAYLHRLAIRRSHVGRGLAQEILSWAVAHVRSLGRQIVRLDCETSRPRLMALYESLGFVHHSDKEIGPYHSARYEYKIPDL